MRQISPLLVCLTLLLAACGTKPVNTTQVASPETQDLRRASFDDFVSRRTLELESMGGPFKKSSVARDKAIEEARARFGDVPADWATIWTWSKKSDQAKAQAEVNSQLDKLARRKTTD